MEVSVPHSVVHNWHAAARRYRFQTAVDDGTTRWSYDDLNRRANAWRLRIEACRTASPIVAIQLPHNVEVCAAALGILAAKRAFVALDPSQPIGLRVLQLRDSGAEIVLAPADEGRLLKTAGWNGAVIDPAAISDRNEGLPPLDVAPTELACICFTSGSYGRPKAVAWPHHTLAFAAHCLGAMLSFASGDRHALLAGLAIASTPAQVFASLAAGASLCLFEARSHNTAELATWLRRSEITTLQTIPSLFRALTREATGTTFPALRAVKLGGEPVTALDAKLFASVTAPSAILVNGLGLTEAGFNICSHIWLHGDRLDDFALPLGVPFAGVELEIVSPVDGIGEIIVRSPFVATPFRGGSTVYCDVAGRPGWRELRTGDLGRLCPDGSLAYVGRRDDLVKIRGKLVVLGDVEAALMCQPGVVRAMALPRHEGEVVVQLCAFVETSDPAITPRFLRERLATQLPDAAIPSVITLVEEWPRLSSGKVNRQALLAHKPASDIAATPVDALERTLLALFHQALPHQACGVNDSFFDRGGDSMSAARLFAAIARVLRIALPLIELKTHSTVVQLAARIRAGGWNLTDHPTTLLTLRPDADAKPVFAWPGAGSDVTSLADLAQHLGPTIALHSIQYRGADGRRVYDLSILTMAERSVELIRRVQPCGPYRLCGSSFGGRVALEVARRLREEGETVSFLGLLDTYAPGYPPRRRGLSLGGHVRWLLRTLKPIGRRDEKGAAIVWQGIRAHAQRLAARFVIGRHQPGSPPFPSPTRYFYVQEACLQASRRLRPTSYDGDVHLFRVDTPPPAELFVLDDLLGWGPWLTGRIKVDVIPGRHGMHLREPNVATLAAKLRDAIADAEHVHRDVVGPMCV